MRSRDILEHWLTAAVEFLPELVLIAIILVLTRFVALRTHHLVQRLSARTQAPPEIGMLLGRIARFGVALVGILLVLQQLGWTQTAIGFATGLGIGGIVIGFALQDIVKQFAAGVLLLMLRPFRVGDLVKVTSFEGTVMAIQLRATVLKTADGDEVLIPNADVYNNAVINRTRYPVRRRTVSLSVPPGVDLAASRSALLEAVAALPGVTKTPPPLIVGTGLDDGKVTAELRFWIDTDAGSPDVVATEAIAVARRLLGARTSEEAE